MDVDGGEAGEKAEVGGVVVFGSCGRGIVDTSFGEGVRGGRRWMRGWVMGEAR